MELLDIIKQFFDEDDYDWRYMSAPDDAALHLVYLGDNGQYQCMASALEDAQRIFFYSLLPVNVPAAKRLAVAEFLTRANYGLLIGNFELSFETGQVRYKTSVDVESVTPTTVMIRNLVVTNLAMIDRYLPGVMAMIYGNQGPVDAIAMVEEGEGEAAEPPPEDAAPQTDEA